MDVLEYQGLLRAYWREEGIRAKGHPGLRPKRTYQANAQRLVEVRQGRELIGALPSTREIRAGVREHLERRLGLAGLHVSAGRVRLSGAFRPLDSRFESVRMKANDRAERYWLFCSFEVPFAARTAEGLFRDHVLVDQDDDGRWRCRSDPFTRESIRQRLLRPQGRIVVVTVPNQAAAEAVARAARPKAIDVEVWPQTQWNRMEGDLLLGALHRPVHFKKVSRRLARKLAKEIEQATTPLQIRNAYPSDSGAVAPAVPSARRSRRTSRRATTSRRASSSTTFASRRE